jgi:DMSO/TMAO reductase YedYZ molybdopterin-dependent catalytic subunit
MSKHSFVPPLNADPNASEAEPVRGPLDRRRFLAVAACGAAAGLLAPGAGRAETPLGSFRAGVPAITREGPTGIGRYRDELVKDLSQLTDLSFRSQGAQWWRFNTFMTPIEQFFIRNTYATPRPELDQRVDPQHWRLTVHGNGVERELSIGYEDLLKMPSRSIVSTLECAGNGRSMFWEQQGMTKGDTQVKGNGWGLGAVGQAEWQYVPMSHILGLAGLRKSAKWALFWSGVDGKTAGRWSDIGRPLPIGELTTRGDDIGLAYKMNGLDLPADHGGPVRVIVPGWTGAASIKWLTEIKIADHNFWVPLSAFDHVFEGPTYKPPRASVVDEFRFCKPDQIKGPMVTWLKPKSLITLPLMVTEQHALPHNYPLKLGERPRLASGKRTITGYAWGPQFGIARVDYRIDGGAWRRAKLRGPNMGRYTWVRFSFEWDATPGDHVIETRATDLGAQTQPDATIPFNTGGYEFWGVPRMPVTIV